MKKSEKQLLDLYRQLPADDRKTLLDFASFLVERAPDEDPLPTSPMAIPRPAEESVVAALKRLSATYPMLDKAKMLHESSTLMTQHVMQGRAAADVIDDLEAVFRRYYDEFAASE